MADWVTSTLDGSATQPGTRVVQVSEQIANLHPSVAVVRSLLGSENITTDDPQWPVDKYVLNRTLTTVSGRMKAEGVDADTVTATGMIPTKLRNQTRILHAALKVSRTARQVRYHGITDTLDYAIDQLIHTIVNDSEMLFHWGLGTKIDGSTAADDIPGLLGLVPWAAWTGLERRHGSQTTTSSVTLPFATQTDVSSDYYSSFWDAGGVSLSRENLYGEILDPWWNIGGEVEGSFCLLGNKLMNLVADMHMSSKGQVNERVLPARDKALVDCIMTIQTPGMGEFYLMVDRYLSIPGESVTIDNKPVLTSGVAAAGTGTITSSSVGAATLNNDSTMLFVMPDLIKIGTLSPIAYSPLATDGDYVKGMVVSEETLIPSHPMAVAGASNLLP